jgi:uncharacterized protein YjeT (DUF2065 family)
MGITLLGAFALMLVMEGLLPFLSPRLWRVVFQRMIDMTDVQIRFTGLCSMMGGVILLVVFFN